MVTKHKQDEHAFSNADNAQILERVINDRLELLEACKEAARLSAGDRADWEELPVVQLLRAAIAKAERP